MPIATPQGTLDFKSVDKVTFVGASSNTVIDTTTGSLGVGVDVNGPTSNLHVVGNAYVSSNLTVSGNVEVGTANLFVDTVNSRVGIGTMSAEVPFNVVGNNALSGTPNNAIATFRATTTSPGTNDAGVVIGSINGNTPYIADVSTASLGLSFYTQSVERMRILANGSVGIGTTSPQASFHVYPINGTMNSENTFIDFRREFSPHGHLGIFATETHTNAIGPDLRFKGAVYNGTSNPTINQVICLKPTGKVGIGKTSPDTALDVNGIIKQTGANWALTNGGVSYSQYRGAYPGDYGYFNRTLSTPTNVTLTHQNQGGYNTRSRITINTAGKYAMYVNGFRQSGTTGTKELQIHKNGSYVSVRAYSGDEGTNNYMTVGSGYTIMDLNANDYVEVKLNHCTFHGNDSLYFIGHLIA